MRAIDTNVVIRLIAGDDRRQTEEAERLRGGGLFVPRTVLLESEWVLRSGFRWSRERVNGALRALLAAPGVTTAELADVVWALERHAAGADFADMLHVAAAQGYDSFATFDRDVERQAGPNPPVPVETLG